MKELIIKISLNSLTFTILISVSILLFMGLYKIYAILKVKYQSKSLSKLQEEFKRKFDIAIDTAPNTPEERKHGSFKKYHKEAEEKHSTEYISMVSKALKKADTMFAQGDVEEAQELLLQALSNDPENENILLKLAMVYLHNKLYFKAETLYIKLIEMGHKTPAIFTNLGHALYYQSKFPLAKDAYQKAIAMDKDSAHRYYHLAQVLHDTGETYEAIEILKKIYEKEKKSKNYWYTLSILFEDTGDEKNLKESLTNLTKLEPFNKEYKRKLAGLGEK